MPSFDPADAKPTGVPNVPRRAVRDINRKIGEMVNLPGPGQAGLLLPPGRTDEVSALAQVSIALSLEHIAQSLRLMSGRSD